MQTNSPAILVSLSVALTPLLGNPATAGTLNSIFGTLLRISRYYSKLRQFHIIMNSFNSV